MTFEEFKKIASEEALERLQSTETVEQLKVFALENSFELTEQELSEAEAATVTGGQPIRPVYKTPKIFI